MKIKIIIVIIVGIFFIENLVIAANLNSLVNNITINSATNTYFQFSSDSFLSSAKDYNSEIAELSSILSAAAYNYDDPNNYQKYIEDALSSLGFSIENTRFYNYDKVYTLISNRVGYTFSYKTIETDDITYNLVIAVVRGTTKGEWYSNFAVSNGIVYNNNVHYGFNSAEVKMNKDFQDYMKEMNLNKDIEKNKVLITGHSRGGAIANLFARRLIESQKLCFEDNIYAYTFGSPNVEKNVAPYENVFNIVYGSDFVTRVPLVNWGFNKNGTTIEFFDPHDSRFENEKLFESMKRNYYSLTGYEFKDFQDYSIYEDAMSAFNDLAPTVRDYYRTKTSRYPYITLYEYTLLFSYAMANEDNLTAIITWALNTSEDKSVYKPLTNFFVKDMMPNYEITSAHSPETYISWIKAYNENGDERLN